ncbi:UNVERIFIED_CONTAM: hypothetical protein H355_004896 [Colinus virginianus]|nr:hypothetical protein H355_004896 [Colinus virginianus]
MEGDGCTVCSTAEAKLVALSHRLNCSQQEPNHPKKRCSDAEKPPASQPILLQHYPLYRKSDAECSGEDAAPPEEKTIPFKEKYDVLSQEASQKVFSISILSIGGGGWVGEWPGTMAAKGKHLLTRTTPSSS